MSKRDAHRLAIENALRSTVVAQDVATLILDHYDQGVAFAWEGGKDDCAARVIELVQEHIQMIRAGQ
jgi:hypothetical protein